MIAGDIQVNLLDIELLTIKVRLVIASLETAKEVGKGYGDAKALAQTSTEERAKSGPAGKGTAYLLRRRAELAAQQDVERRAASEADALHAALLERAVDGHRRPVTDPVLTGNRAWMIFNGT